jgi:hypothetical protein
VFYPGLLGIEASWLLLMEGIPLQIDKMELISVWSYHNTTDQTEEVLSSFVNGQNGKDLKPGYYQSSSLAFVQNKDWAVVHEVKLFLLVEDPNRRSTTLMKDQLRYRPSLVDTSSAICIGFLNAKGGTEVLTFWPNDVNQWRTEDLPDFYKVVFDGFMASPWHYKWKDFRNPFQIVFEVPEAILWDRISIQSFDIEYNKINCTIALTITL